MNNDALTAILLLAHGSRAMDANGALFRVADDLRFNGQFELVECAFLELTQPDIRTGLDNCRSAGVRRVIIIPYFLHLGRHVKEDLPGIINAWCELNPGISVTIGSHLGYSPKLTELVKERIGQALGQ